MSSYNALRISDIRKKLTKIIKIKFQNETWVLPKSQNRTSKKQNL